MKFHPAQVTNRLYLLPALCALSCSNAALDEVEGSSLPLLAADCTRVDWSTAQLTMSQPNEVLSEVRAELSDNQLCVLATGTNIANAKYNLFVETDGKLSTGIQPKEWLISGADYFVYNGTLFEGTSALFDGSNPVVGDARVPLAGENQLMLRVPLKPEQAHQNIGIGFQITQNDVSQAHLPQHFAFERLGGGHVGDELRSDACPVLGDALDPAPQPAQPIQSRMFSRGMIAPIYLPPTAPVEQWQRVAEAAIAQGAESGARPDFWVTLIGADSAPPNEEAWPDRMLAWKPVLDASVPVAGYVHTLVHHKDANGAVIQIGPEYRPLPEVEQEITNWVSHLPSVQAIWLDEFVPRYEVAPPMVAGPSPNPQYKPTDPNIDRFPSNFGGLQVDATCGYYDRLQRWIRASYPGLRIIGNPGGKLETNQRVYARLVDVLVSFEHSLAEAGQSDWAVLRDSFAPLAHANLALFHAGKPSDARTVTRRAAIDQALSIGYTHVYATDSLYDSGMQTDPMLLGSYNVWGNLPVDALGSSANDAMTQSTTNALAEQRRYIASP